ncbi:MAG: hypothetical protein JWM11_125 [Planctomycetaceae bacterium]|nr:hypothetical protein [Planctomycetaceae bacterium]
MVKNKRCRAVTVEGPWIRNLQKDSCRSPITLGEKVYRSAVGAVFSFKVARLATAI